MKSFRTQLVGSTVLLVAAVMIVLIGVSQVALEWTTHHEIDKSLSARTATAVGLLDASPTPKGTWLEPGTRVYDAAGKGVAGTLQHVAAKKAKRLVSQVLSTGHQVTSAGPHDYHLQATPYRGGVIVVSQSANPYEHAEIYALIAQVALGIVVVGLAGLIALRVSRRALAPVEQMARTATEWSESDLSHRFSLGPPTNELGALGETLDHLLDRVAGAIRSEQRLTAELAHELRTPLTAIRGSAELALMRPDGAPELHEDLEGISTATRRMDGVITTLLDLARAAEPAAGRCDAIEVIARVAGLVPEGLKLETSAEPDLPELAAPEDLAVRALAPLVENACRHAATTVTLAAAAVPGGIEITVSDDGAGVGAVGQDDLFEPGRSASGSTGLGLGIARRVARSLGGDVILRDGSRAEFVLHLPRG